MKCADIIRFVSYSSIPVLSFFNMLSIFQIYVVAIISGIGLVFHSISEVSIIPSIVKEEDFGRRKQLYIRYSKCFGIFGPYNWRFTLYIYGIFNIDFYRFYDFFTLIFQFDIN